MRMTFRQKLTALVALAAVAMLGLVVASWLLAARVDRYILEIQQRHLPRIGLQGELASQLERVERALQDAVAARDTDLLEAAREKENALLGQISAAASALDEGQATALKIAIADYFTRAYGVSKRLIAGETGETIVE